MSGFDYEQASLFPLPERRSAKSFMDEAIEKYGPIKIFGGFSGGGDSLALCHWLMSNYPDAGLFHIVTGIGIPETQEFVVDACRHHGWPLTIIRAKEHCGQDYDAIVRAHGFPGPASHQFMYRRLKERAVEKLLRDTKTKRSDRVLFATGVRQDESARRMGYGGQEIRKVKAQIWVNPIYWWTRSDRDRYLDHHSLHRSPISQQLGMSGECLCGAFAHPGELEQVRAVCPEIADRIDALHAEIKDRFPWGWEGRPPKSGPPTGNVGMLCIGCEKSSVVQAAIADLFDEDAMTSLPAGWRTCGPLPK